VLGLARLRGSFPEHLYLSGFQPEDISTGMDLPPALQAVLEGVAWRARQILKDW
jgi:hypothetical protein